MGDVFPARKPDLKLVDTPPEPPPPRRRLDPVDRDMHARMIHHYRRRYAVYGIQIIIDQALSEAGVAMVYDLDDDALLALRRDIDRAWQCIEDGVAFEEAGLIRGGGWVRENVA